MMNSFGTPMRKIHVWPIKTVRRPKGANNVCYRVRLGDTPFEADVIISYEFEFLFARSAFMKEVRA